MRAAEIKMLRDYGYTPAQIQRLTKSVKGAVIAVGVGITEVSIQLTGTAKFLLGLRTAEITSAGITYTLKLNNETILDTVSESLTNAFSAVRDEYIEVFRKLNGQDVLTITFNSAGAVTCNPMIFYLS